MPSNSPDSFEIGCPNPACGSTAEVPGELSGKTLRCRTCGTEFTVPSSSDDTPLPLEPTAPELPVTSPVTTVPETIGRYRILRVLGQGGFGTVFLARDPQLKREVALKVPREGTLDSPQRVRRFLGDARSAAQLRHPNIVPVFDAGQADGHYYIASAFIHGSTLADLIEENGANKKPFEFRRVANLVRKLAAALAYAHERNIVHRDVKPDNILLEPAVPVTGREEEPHLIDFGLAWRAEDPEAFESREEEVSNEEMGRRTQMGAVLGTPTYMSPEAAQGYQGEARGAMDQYNLGIVLYELLTGRVPFSGDLRTLRHHHLLIPPPAPRTLRPDLPEDLEAICLKALAKNPLDRYPDCAALAEDLRRWLADEPVSVRRPPLLERFRRWARREWRVAFLAAAVLVSLLVGTVASLLFGWSASAQARRADLEASSARAEQQRAVESEKKADGLRQVAEEQTEKEKAARKELAAALRQAQQAEKKALASENAAKHAADEANDARQKATTEEEKTRRLLQQSRVDQYFNSIALAERELRGFQIDRARALLKNAGQLGVPLGWEWSCLQAECDQRKRIERPIRAMAFRPSGTVVDPLADDWLAWANDKNQVILRQRGNQPNNLRVLDAPGPVRCLAFSGDGLTLAVGCDTGEVVRWTFLQGAFPGQAGPTLVREVIKADLAVTALALGSNGSKLLYGQADGLVVHWSDAAGKKPLPREHFAEIRSLAFDPKGEWALSVCKGNRVRIIDLATNKKEKSLESFSALALHPLGKYSYVAKEGGRIVAYTTKPPIRESLQYNEHGGDVIGLVTNLGLKGVDRVASLDEEGILRVWEVREKNTLDYHTCRAFGSFALNRKGEDIAWVGDRQTVFVRTVGVPREPTAYDFTTGANARSEGDTQDSLAGYAQYTHGLAYSRDGATLVSACGVPNRDQDSTDSTRESGEVTLWDLKSGARRRRFTDKVSLWTVDVSSTRQIVWAGESASLLTTSLGGEADPVPFTGSYAGVNLVRFNPSGALLASAHTDGQINLWDPATRFLRKSFPLGASSVSLAWNPAGDLLFAGDDNGAITCWTAGGDMKWTQREAHLGRVWSLVVLPHESGERLASAGEDGTIKIWKADGTLDRSLTNAHEHGVLGLAILPDGSRLASVGRDKTIRLWEVGTWREVLTLPSTAGLRPGLAFRPDGKELAVATVQGILRLRTK
jgi:WD40 repeat protein/tRNA A-37 threonylcarbamoyl transferase component Bud32